MRKCSVVPSLVGFALVGMCAATTACSTEDPGTQGLMVVTTTDMQIPKDITHVGLQVIDANGVARLERWYEVGPDPKQQLPGTIGIAPGDSDESVTIRVYSRQGDAVRSIAEAVTRVPRDRTALLRLPIEWLSTGMVETNDAANESASGSEGNPDDFPLTEEQQRFAAMRTSCAKGKTARLGTCVSSAIDVATLPDYEPSLVFGADEGSGKGTCFDTVGCFERPQPMAIEHFGKCRAVLENGDDFDPKSMSVGLMTAGGAGICSDSGCVVPLDWAGENGQDGYSVSDGKVLLPEAVCARLEAGAVRAVVASDSCASKVVENPTCGPWSSVDSKASADPVSVDRLEQCQNFVNQVCDGMRRCGQSGAFYDKVWQNDGSCTERLGYLCDPSLVSDKAEPWETYFSGCGEAFAKSDCDEALSAVRRDCVEPAGSKNEGDRCSFGQCAEGLTCLGAVPGGSGTCVERFSVDAPQQCGLSGPLDLLFPVGACESGLLCDPSTLTCHEAALEGEPCVTDYSCDSGLTCLGGSCEKSLDAGDSCRDDAECGLGLHCIGTGGEGSCRGPGGEGKSCAVVSADPVASAWAENLCDLKKGLRCDLESFTCKSAVLVGIGDACSPRTACAGGSCSGLGEGAGTAGDWKCDAYTADGGDCDSSEDCAPPASCLAGVCRLVSAFGSDALTMTSAPGNSAACSDGLRSCSGDCVDVTKDPENCGGCGVGCAEGALCDEGLCTCGSKALVCEGRCTEVLTDEANCGRCGRACASGSSCLNGVCTCGSGAQDCDGTCVDTETDPSNCGACGRTCAAGASCIKGDCACDSGELDCAGTCVDTKSDRNHCGECGNACEPDANCQDGECVAAVVANECAAGQLGPNDYCWLTWTQSAAASAEFLAVPNSTRVSVLAQSGKNGTAGMRAQGLAGEPLGLERAASLWFDADVPEGELFAVTLRRDDLTGCAWLVQGRGKATYEVDLTEPADTCWPTNCGFDRTETTSIDFGTAMWGDAFMADISLTDLGFTRSSTAIDTVTKAAGATRSLNGWCWALYDWYGDMSGGAAATLTSASATQIVAQAVDTSKTASAGLVVELPAASRDFTNVGALELMMYAVSSEAGQFELALKDSASAGCTLSGWASLSAAVSKVTFSLASLKDVDLGTKANCWLGSGGKPLDLTDIQRLEIGSLWTAQDTLVLALRSLSLVASTANPQGCIESTNILSQRTSDGENWIGGDPASVSDNVCGVQGAVYAYGDSAGTLKSPALVEGSTTYYLSPCNSTGCCISGATMPFAAQNADGTYTFEEWGASIALGLNSDADSVSRAYAGDAVGFNIHTSGKLTGQELRVLYTQRASDPNQPFKSYPAGTGIGNLSVRFDEVVCPNWDNEYAANCTAGGVPYDIQLQVVGGGDAGDFTLCIDSVTPILPVDGTGGTSGVGGSTGASSTKATGGTSSGGGAPGTGGAAAPGGTSSTGAGGTTGRAL